ncbi:MAG: hypothetical protein U0992_23990 [Planctomycetaceae bacterium]
MRPVCLAVALSCFLSSSLVADDYKLAEAQSPPKDVPAEIAKLLAAEGQQVDGPKRPLCSIWLLKDVSRLSDFKPSTAVKYPFTPGQLVGILSVPRRAGLTDFKGQELEPGLYTLRYGQQPMDGNHIGTSDTADFLLAIPVANDSDPAPIADVKEMFKRSAGASGTTHPAIFSLLAPEEEQPEVALEHDEEQDFWVLETIAKAGDLEVPLRLVVVGKSKG